MRRICRDSRHLVRNTGVRVKWLPWVNALRPRPLSSIELVVLHATEEPTLEDARLAALNSADHVSGHIYVDRDGTLEEWVPADRIAHHTVGYNRQSIGIELVNRGRYPDHFSSRNQEPREPFPESQILALEGLLRELIRECPSISRLERHSSLDLRMRPSDDRPDVQVRRRIDPGPRFPWGRVRSSFLADLSLGRKSER